MNRDGKTDKKNIALMLPNLAGGGAERVAAELSCFFMGEGHRVYIFTQNRQTTYRFVGKIVKLNPLKKSVAVCKELYDLYYLSEEIKRQKRKYHIDVAISFMEKYNMANILSQGREKVIVRVCTILSSRNDMKGVYYNRFLLKALYNRADYVVVLSQYGKKDMIKNYHVKSNKLKVIPNAVIPRDCCDNIPWQYGNKVILSVNRIHPIKQQEIMIDAITEIIHIIPEVKLLLVGNDTDNYAKKLKYIVKRQGLEKNIVFTGHVNNVEYYMRHSQVLLLTSVAEGFSNVIIEGMNQGLPVITTDFAGPCREILGVSSSLGCGKYGIIVPEINENKKDAEYYKGIRQLSSVLTEVLTNPELAARYSEASKVRAEYYAKDKIEDLWRRII